MCYPQLRFAAVLYAAVPVAVFLLGWLKLYWGIPTAALLTAGCLACAPAEKSLRRQPQKRRFACRCGRWLWCLCLRLPGAFWAGRAAIFTRTAISQTATAFCTTLNYPWPVYYQSDSGGFGKPRQPFALVYYICHWLLPALAGKLVLAVTGAAGAAWLAANFALFVWTGLGVFLVFCLLAVTLRPQSWVALLAVCVGFMAFSGLDIVGTVWMHQDVGFHIERWAGVNEYSSMTTCLFWVFNQTVVPWLMTLCVLNESV